jgi:hypothetical protein
LAPATWALTPAAAAGCSSAGGAPTARRRPPNARCPGGGVLSRPGRMPSRPTGSRASPILQESHWTSQWPEWSASPGGHGDDRAEDSLSGAGRFRKALRPGHCPLDRERTAARSNSSGRGGKSGTLRERSALLGPLGPGSTAGDFFAQSPTPPQERKEGVCCGIVSSCETSYVGFPGNACATDERMLRLPPLWRGDADDYAGADVGVPRLSGQRRSASASRSHGCSQRGIDSRGRQCRGGGRSRSASRDSAYRPPQATSA